MDNEKLNECINLLKPLENVEMTFPYSKTAMLYHKLIGLKACGSCQYYKMWEGKTRRGDCIRPNNRVGTRRPYDVMRCHPISKTLSSLKGYENTIRKGYVKANEEINEEIKKLTTEIDKISKEDQEIVLKNKRINDRERVIKILKGLIIEI